MTEIICFVQWLLLAETSFMIVEGTWVWGTGGMILTWTNWSVLRKKNVPQITHGLAWYKMWAASVKMGCYHRSPPEVSVIICWMTWCHLRILESLPSVEISLRFKPLEWIFIEVCEDDWGWNLLNDFTFNSWQWLRSMTVGSFTFKISSSLCSCSCLVSDPCNVKLSFIVAHFHSVPWKSLQSLYQSLRTYLFCNFCICNPSLSEKSRAIYYC